MELGLCIGCFVICFQSETDQHLIFFLRYTQRCSNVLSRFQLKYQIILLPLDFMVSTMVRCKIGHSCTKDSGICILIGIFGGFIHFLCTFHIYPMNVRMMRFQGNRSADQYNFSSTGSTFFCQSVSHFARRIIADETYGVYFLISRTSSNHYLFTLQILLLGKERLQNFHNLFRFFHTAFSYQMAGQFSFTRFDDMIPVGTEDIQILLSRWMGKHVEVHGRSNENGCLHGQISGNQHVVSHTMGHLSDGAGRSRCNHHGIRPKSQIHMTVPSAVSLREKLADDRFAGQCRQCNGCNEFLTGRSDDHLYFSSFLDKGTNEYSRFVGGYASGYT